MQEDYPRVGVEEIDRDHEALEAHLHRLLAAVKDDDCTRAVPLAAALMKKARAHFRLEERLMREIDFPFAARHQATHQQFLADGLRHLEELRTDGLCGPFLRWISDTMGWFGRHVRTEDLALARAVMAARQARHAHVTSK